MKLTPPTIQLFKSIEEKKKYEKEQKENYMLSQLLYSVCLCIASPNYGRDNLPMAFPPILEPHFLAPEELKLLEDVRRWDKDRKWLDAIDPDNAPHSFEEARLWGDLV